MNWKDELCTDFSPPSSPNLGAVDSSPPSSPSVGPVATPPASPGPIDPYAGSTKAYRRPHLYEKRVPVGWGRGGSKPDGGAEAHDVFNAAGERSQQTHPLGHAHRCSTESILSSPRKYRSAVSSTQLGDPLAASAKMDWKPPRREKKNSRVISNDSIFSNSSMLSDDSHDFVFGEYNVGSVGSVETDLENESTGPVLITPEAAEQARWDDVITNAIDSANGIIDVSPTGILASRLTSIPPSIADLAGLVVLPSSASDLAAGTPSAVLQPRAFTRAATVPSLVVSEQFFSRELAEPGLRRAMPLAKTATTLSLKASSTSKLSGIQLFFAGNAFRRLPVELFQLTGITFITLRGNKLSSIPPQIAQLTNLHSLNIAANRLQWLPAEMLNMHLTSLHLNGNPWLSPPAANDFQRFHDAAAQHGKKVVSPTVVRFTIPTLVESCIRVLLSPTETQSIHSQNEGRVKRVLDDYELPLTEGLHLGPAVLETLRSCLPYAVAKPAKETTSPAKKPRRRAAVHVHSGQANAQQVFSPLADADDAPPGISICSSPIHRTPEGAWVDGRMPIFVQHAEERFTWERIIAGLDVVAENGENGVPVRWRGCSVGCLDFLDEGQREPERDVEGVTETDDGMDVDIEDGDQQGVRVVQLRAGGLDDMEEFD